MDLIESLHILERLGLSHSKCADSILSSVVAEVTGGLQAADHESLIQVATKLLPFVTHDLFTPIWFALLGMLAVNVHNEDGKKILTDMTRKEIESYQGGTDFLPVPVLEQLCLIHLPALEQRVIAMVDKLLTGESSNDIEDVIMSSKLVSLSQREPHVKDCICSMLDALMPHWPAKIQNVGKCFTLLVNRGPNR